TERVSRMGQSSIPIVDDRSLKAHSLFIILRRIADVSRLVGLRWREVHLTRLLGGKSGALPFSRRGFRPPLMMKPVSVAPAIVSLSSGSTTAFASRGP